METPWIIQIGHSRDGLRNYAIPCLKRGISLCIIDTPAGALSQRKADILGEPCPENIIETLSDSHSSLIVEAINFAKTHNVIQIVAGFELFTLTAAHIRQTLKLSGPTPETINLFRSKSEQRIFLAKHNILQPKFKVCQDLEEAKAALEVISYPAVIKPDDAGGSQAVCLVKSIEDLIKAVSAAASVIKDDGQRANGKILVEQFIPGEEFGISGIVDEQGNIHILAVTERVIYRGKDGTVCMILRDVARPAKFVPNIIKLLAQNVIFSLGLRSSPFDMDVRLPNSQTAIFIEAGARITGGGVPACYRLMGFDMGEIAMQAILGENIASDYDSADLFCGQHYITLNTLQRVLRILMTSETLHAEEKAEIIFFGNSALNLDYSHISSRSGVVRAIAANNNRVNKIIDDIILKNNLV